MKRWTLQIIVCLIVVGTVGALRVNAEADSKTAPEVLCPVMGEPVNFAISTPTDDGPVFLCCKGCAKKLTKNPGEYEEEVAAQRKALAKRPRVQTRCPLTGEPFNPKISVEHGGGKVLLCCEGCAKKFKKDPKKYAAKLASSYTYQTQCPVSKEPIDPTVFATTAGGKQVFFCCNGCNKKFFKDPAKYAPNLVSQGFEYKLAELAAPSGDSHEHDHDHTGHDHDAHGHGDGH